MRRAAELLRVGCAAGSLTTENLGAIPALPAEEEVLRAAALPVKELCFQNSQKQVGNA